MHRIISGDVLRFAAHYHGPKFHAVLCDPPYELGFMGKSWDSRGVSFSAETWSAIRSLLVPGAHLLAFGGTRTFHRIAVAIEDAGFEIRDTLGWLYGSGFPKSHDVSKAIDREAGAVRSEGDRLWSGGMRAGGISHGGDQSGTTERLIYDTPATDAAKAWQGYGTALKPAWEPVIVARNPLSGTVAQNAMEHGAGALNVDGGRVGDEGGTRGSDYPKTGLFGIGGNASIVRIDAGRWPANIIHDGSDEVTDIFPHTKASKKTKISDGRSVPFMQAGGEKSGGSSGRHDPNNSYDDNGGSAARFFYCAKASKRERDEGLSGFELRVAGVGNVDEASVRDSTKPGNQFGQGSRLRVEAGLSPTIPRANHHPTVKPVALTEYLAKLILPAAVVGDRRILVPFAGSGSECIGAMLAGWETIVGVEREDEYVKIARARMEYYAS